MRGPPARRVAQASLAVGVWVFLLGAAVLRITQGRLLSWLALGLLLVVGAWALDAYVPSIGLGAVRRGRQVRRGHPRRVALTFDDGPSADTPSVLAELDRAGVRATFFVLGSHAELYPELIRSMVRAGHVVGNHTWSHRALALAPRRVIAEEIDRTQELLKALGAAQEKLFRAPRGFQGSFVRQVLRSRGLKLIAWTRGAWDSEPLGPVEIAARATRKTHDGDILLLHDGASTPAPASRAATARAVPLIIAAYQSRGFQFVTVPELLTHG
jgi:peptidoglycan/xylan/chitin deacetylase (PgdA/CDA1 family)